MPTTARSISDYRVLIAPGLNGSGPDHWQTRWQRLYPTFERVEQASWDVPDLPAWSERVGQALRASDHPALIVAHSFGCLATVHRAAIEPGNLLGVLLVAPADPDKFGVANQLRVKLQCPSIIVASTDDPWMVHAKALDWARTWGGDLVTAGACGHINTASGLGDWPFGLSQLQRLILAVQAEYARPQSS